MRCATRRLAACDAARGRRAVAEVDQVNQKIARHTQNSAAQWNLNSARAVELNSLRNPVRPTTPRALPPFPFLFLSLIASYSLSFVIRKQTERRSCQVGGVGDETAVSVLPSFFRLRRRPPTGVYNPSYLTSFARSLPYPFSAIPGIVLSTPNPPSHFPEYTKRKSQPGDHHSDAPELLAAIIGIVFVNQNCKKALPKRIKSTAASPNFTSTLILCVTLEIKEQYVYKNIQECTSLKKAYVNLGAALISVGRGTDAAAVLRAGASLDGSGLKDKRAHEAARVQALLQLGALYADQGRLQRALSAYREALRALPDHYPPQSAFVSFASGVFRYDTASTENLQESLAAVFEWLIRCLQPSGRHTMLLERAKLPLRCNIFGRYYRSTARSLAVEIYGKCFRQHRHFLLGSKIVLISLSICIGIDHKLPDSKIKFGHYTAERVADLSISARLIKTVRRVANPFDSRSP
ncbi:Transmembrane and TPR repeat-containing protein [Acromyrmex echinatior]|uniref:Transmembrane and TPR repeat-containing protein n=1 Tax=Acromyrmex echinatior TaxID=103372 RepID=F4WW44_ACREC|nr:Transmembrane and TPR repeat-containing protein [Acromyrmex echinatior]